MVLRNYKYIHFHLDTSTEAVARLLKLMDRHGIERSSPVAWPALLTTWRDRVCTLAMDLAPVGRPPLTAGAADMVRVSV